MAYISYIGHYGYDTHCYDTLLRVETFHKANETFLTAINTLITHNISMSVYVATQLMITFSVYINKKGGSCKYTGTGDVYTTSLLGID